MVVATLPPAMAQNGAPTRLAPLRDVPRPGSDSRAVGLPVAGGLAFLGALRVFAAPLPRRVAAEVPCYRPPNSGFALDHNHRVLHPLVALVLSWAWRMQQTMAVNGW